MTRTVLLALGACLLVPSAALASDFVGDYALEGTYNDRRKTRVALRVEQTDEGLEVTRTARFSARARAATPSFVWRSVRVQRSGRGLIVIYVPKRRAAVGATGALEGASRPPARRGVWAWYWFERDGLRELVWNMARTGQESWRSIKTRGSRDASPPAWLDAVKRDYRRGIRSASFETLGRSGLPGPAHVPFRRLLSIARSNGSDAAAARSKKPGLAIVMDVVYEDGGEVRIFDASGTRLLAFGEWLENGTLKWHDAPLVVAREMALAYWGEGSSYFPTEEAWQKWYDQTWGDDTKWVYLQARDGSTFDFVLGSEDLWAEVIRVDPATGKVEVIGEH